MNGKPDVAHPNDGLLFLLTSMLSCFQLLSYGKTEENNSTNGEAPIAENVVLWGFRSRETLAWWFFFSE